MFIGGHFAFVQRQDAVGVRPGVTPAAGAGVEQEHPAPLFCHRDVGVTEESDVRAPGCGCGWGGVLTPGLRA